MSKRTNRYFFLFILFRRLIYGLTLFLSRFSLKRAGRPRLWVLCYHGFGSGWYHDVDMTEFEKQMDFLKKKFKPLAPNELVPVLTGEKFLSEDSFLITIDDAYADVYALRSYFANENFKPILFVLSRPAEAVRSELDNEKDFLRAEEILLLKNDGWLIGSHGACHPNMNILDECGIEAEIKGSKHELENALKIPIDLFSYPRGRYNGRIINSVIQAGYKAAFCMDEGYYETGSNPLLIPRIGVNRSLRLFEIKSLVTPLNMRVRKFASFVLRKFMNI